MTVKKLLVFLRDKQAKTNEVQINGTYDCVEFIYPKREKVENTLIVLKEVTEKIRLLHYFGRFLDKLYYLSLKMEDLSESHYFKSFTRL